MIDMGVRQQQEIDTPRIEREVAVIEFLQRFWALIKTAINKELLVFPHDAVA